MARKSKFSKEIKIKACEDYLSGKKSVIQIAIELSVIPLTVRRWTHAFSTHGEVVFNDNTRNKSYSKEFKLQVVKEYLNDEGSMPDIALKYGIPSDSMVSQWVKVYNSGKELEDYDPKGEVYTMKARRTTFEERLEIVKYVLDYDKNYKQAAEKYLLPYSLVYQWTQKYLERGEDSLKHQKKGPKPKDLIQYDLSEKDKLLRENELLRRQLEYVKLENQVLKKKEQLERQAELQRLGRKRRT